MLSFILKKNKNKNRKQGLKQIFIHPHSQAPKGRNNPNTHQQININKMCYAYTMEYHSSLKEKKILTPATTQMTSEDISLSEIHQTQNDKYCMIPLIWNNQSSQIHRGRKQNGSTRGSNQGEMEYYYLMGAEFQFGNMKKFWRCTLMVASQHCECI